MTSDKKDIDLGRIVDVFAEADPGLRDPAVKREVVRGADALLREFEAALERGSELLQGPTADKRPASANGQEEPLVTAAEVARLVSMPEAWVYEAARRGTIPSLRLGVKAVRFRASEVIASFPDGVGGLTINRANCHDQGMQIYGAITISYAIQSALEANPGSHRVTRCTEAGS